MNEQYLNKFSYRNLLIVTASIILSEMLCHFVVNSFFYQQSAEMLLLIDSGLLLLMVIPCLYFFVYKPKINILNELLVAKRANEKLSLIVANSSIMLFSLRVKGEPIINTQWASENVEQILGYSADEVHAPDWWFLNIHPQEQSDIIAKSSTLIEGHQEHFIYEYRFKHKNGEYVWIHDEQKLELDEQGNLLNILCVWKDITEKKMLEMELTIAAHTFESREGIMITDADMRILKVNSTFEHITGHKKNDVVGRSPSILKSGKQDAEYYRHMKESIARNDFWQGEIWNKRKSGEVYPEHLTITAIKDKNGDVTNYIGAFNDITERKAQEARINLEAYYDELTSLPNRRLLLDRLERVITTNLRTKEYAALIFLDMDRFKILNDTYGHDMGDQFLIEISTRLKSCVRESDTLSRFGGDEFVVLLSELSDDFNNASSHAESIAEKIRLRLAEPYSFMSTVNGHDGPITHLSSASIGMVLFSDNETNIDNLLKHSDLAMYESKSLGGNSVCLFESALL